MTAEIVSDLSFEDAMRELESIVRDLETGKANLDDAIKAYERGALLKRHCEAHLARANGEGRTDYGRQRRHDFRRAARPGKIAVSEPTPFELAAGELRKLGITLRQLPGEYSVNFRDGNDATARTAETLEEAVALGRELAADAAAGTTAAPSKRYRRPRRMTPKAQRRRFFSPARPAHARAGNSRAKKKYRRKKIAPEYLTAEICLQ
jgi:exodeoxyribonuclease VII small subunit